MYLLSPEQEDASDGPEASFVLVLATRDRALPHPGLAGGLLGGATPLFREDAFAAACWSLGAKVED